MDKISMEMAQKMHPNLRREILAILEEIDEALKGRAICRFSYTLRTFQEQNDLYAIGRTKAGKKVTNASAGLSFHNYGLAVDIVLIVDGKTAVWDIKKDFDGDGKADWIEIVNIFKQYGWEWGGDWKFVDYPHFQKTFGYSVRQLLQMRKNQLLDNEGYVII